MPESYRPDVLELKKVSDIMSPAENSLLVVDDAIPIKDVRDLAIKNNLPYDRKQVIIRTGNTLRGFVDQKLLFESGENSAGPVSVLIKSKCYSVYGDNSLDLALEFMLKTRQQVLPVVDRVTHELIGIVSERDVLKVFEQRFIEDKRIQQHISIRKKAVRALGKMKVVK
jgi:chloride channel protein, CIC family